MKKILPICATLMLICLIIVPFATSKTLTTIKDDEISILTIEYETPIIATYDFPDFFVTIYGWSFPDGSYIPNQFVDMTNRGADYNGEEITILVAFFIDDDTKPSCIIEYDFNYWGHNENYCSEQTSWDFFPSDFKEHKITRIVDYMPGTLPIDYINGNENGSIYEGEEGEENNIEIYTMRDRLGHIYGAVNKNRANNMVEGKTVRIKGIDNDYEKETITKNLEGWSYNFYFSCVPFGEYVVTVEEDGKILQSKNVEVSFNDRGECVDFTIVKGKFRDIQFLSFVRNHFPNLFHFFNLFNKKSFL